MKRCVPALLITELAYEISIIHRGNRAIDQQHWMHRSNPACNITTSVESLSTRTLDICEASKIFKLYIKWKIWNFISAPSPLIPYKNLYHINICFTWNFYLHIYGLKTSENFQALFKIKHLQFYLCSICFYCLNNFLIYWKFALLGIFNLTFRI